MKKTILVVPLIAALTGCAFLQKNPQAPQFIAQAAAKDVTIVLLSQHPEWRPKFVLAQQQLLSIAQAPKIDISTVAGILDQIPVKELQTETSKILVSDTVLIIKALGNPSLKENQQARLQPIVAGLAAGVEDGIRATKPTTPPAPTP